MLKFTLLGTLAATILSAAAAPPVLAQAANAEPGYCAQFYPNSDCNSVGPDTPGSNKQGEAADEAAPVSPPVKSAKPRKQAHRSAAATADTRKPKADAVPR